MVISNWESMKGKEFIVGKKESFMREAIRMEEEKEMVDL